MEGIPNQLYAQGMLPYQHWDEIVKGFACEDHKSTELPSTDIATYFRNRYALWLSQQRRPEATRLGPAGGERLGGDYAPAR